MFVVRGEELPAAASAPGEGARDCWYRVKDLLEASRGGEGGDGENRPALLIMFLWVLLLYTNCCMRVSFDRLNGRWSAVRKLRRAQAAGVFDIRSS